MFRQPIAGPSFMDVQAATHPLIFVSDTPDGVVDIYPQAGKSQKSPARLRGSTSRKVSRVDAQRNLYVANTNGSNVLVYAPPYSAAPILTLNDAGEFRPTSPSRPRASWPSRTSAVLRAAGPTPQHCLLC